MLMAKLLVDNGYTRWFNVGLIPFGWLVMAYVSWFVHGWSLPVGWLVDCLNACLVGCWLLIFLMRFIPWMMIAAYTPYMRIHLGAYTWSQLTESHNEIGLIMGGSNNEQQFHMCGEQRDMV